MAWHFVEPQMGLHPETGEVFAEAGFGPGPRVHPGVDWLPTLAAFPIGTSALAVGLWWFLARLGWRLTRGSVGTSASILTFALFAAMVGLVTGLLLAYFPPALGEPYFVTDMSIGANEGDPLRVGLGGTHLAHTSRVGTVLRHRGCLCAACLRLDPPAHRRAPTDKRSLIRSRIRFRNERDRGQAIDGRGAFGFGRMIFGR